MYCTGTYVQRTARQSWGKVRDPIPLATSWRNPSGPPAHGIGVFSRAPVPNEILAPPTGHRFAAIVGEPARGKEAEVPATSVVRGALACVMACLVLGTADIAHADSAEPYCLGQVFGEMPALFPELPADALAIRSGCAGGALRIADHPARAQVRDRLVQATLPCRIFVPDAYVTDAQRQAVVEATRAAIQLARQNRALTRPPPPLPDHVSARQHAALESAGVMARLEQALRARLRSRADHLNPDLVATIVTDVLQGGLAARCIVTDAVWFGIEQEAYDRLLRQLNEDILRNARRATPEPEARRIRRAPETEATRRPDPSAETAPTDARPIGPIIAALLLLLVGGAYLLYRRRSSQPLPVVDADSPRPATPPPVDTMEDESPISPKPSSWIGQTIDKRYRITEELGSGGMCQVFSGYHVHTRQPVALKLVHSALESREDIAQRFRQEAQVMAQLNHPNIVRLQDYGILEDGTQYLVMEHLDGRVLAEVLEAAGGILSATDAVRIMTVVLRALHEAHQHGIIHRDLKPENIMLCTSGGEQIVKLIDFGIAAWDQRERVTRTGLTVGTPEYMSPEQAQGESVGPASDLFSAAVVLYEMLTGTLPYQGNGPMAIAMARLIDDAERPSFPPGTDVPTAVIDVMMMALSREPLLRPQSAHDMAQQLLRALKG